MRDKCSTLLTHAASLNPPYVIQQRSNGAISTAKIPLYLNKGLFGSFPLLLAQESAQGAHVRRKLCSLAHIQQDSRLGLDVRNNLVTLVGGSDGYTITDLVYDQVRRPRRP